MVELDHRFDTGKPTDYNWDAVLDLERVIPCVEGGRVLERTSPEEAKAEIKVKMGAMSMTFKGTVTVAERDDAAHTALLRIKSRDTGGSGYANADVTFALDDGGGTIHTAAQISGKAASMGEGVVSTVLDALIKDFTRSWRRLPMGGAGRHAAHAAGRGPGRRRDRAPGRPGPARVPRQRPVGLRLRRVRERARRGMGPSR